MMTSSNAGPAAHACSFCPAKGRARASAAFGVPLRANTSTPRSSTTTGNTVAAASSLDKDLKPALKTGADRNAAAEVGKLIAKRAAEKGVGEVFFDRGGYKYHGRVKALQTMAPVKAGLSSKESDE